MAKKENLDFEQSLKGLEEIVDNMEKKTLSLDDALAQFEKGVSLSKTCQEALNQAELKIQKITQSQQSDS